MLFDKVLVPVDLSDVSRDQMIFASRLRPYGMKELVLFYAVTVGDEPTEEERAKLDALAAFVQDPDVKVHIETMAGSAATAILKAAKRDKATVIVMASSGKTKATELVIGSTSLDVVRRTHIPVLVSRFSSEHMVGVPLLDRVLIALDLGPGTKSLLNVFKDMDAVGCKKAVLFHTVVSSKFSVEDDVKFQQVKADLAKYRERHDGTCVLDTHIHYGTAAYNIMEAAREFDVTLIVMGNVGKGLLHSLTLGSVSDEVLRKTSMPVLIVPCK